MKKIVMEFFRVAWTTTRTWPERLLSIIFIKPFAWLYMKGPRALGFWEGLEESSICSQLTNVRSQFWSLTTDNMAECKETLDRHFWSYIVLASTVTYYITLIVVIKNMLALNRKIK
jgi:hypothetical protein